MKKPKPLSSSKKENKRYIVYQVISDKQISIEEVSNAVWFSCLNYLGELGTGKAELWVGKDLYWENKGMVKCNNNSVNEVKAAITLINRIGENPVIFQILGVVGTIESGKKKYFT